MKTQFYTCLAVAGLMLCPLAVSAAPCADGDLTVSATFPDDPGFEGLWKYTISGDWDTGVGMGGGLSHISFLIEIECACVCDETFATFDDPAGTATGVDSLGNPCDAEFIGLNECEGDPGIGSDSPAIKFELPEGQNCETTASGTGTWCFYSAQPPLADDTYTDAVVIKYGSGECTGDLVGALPDCSVCGPVPTKPATWGELKERFGE